MTEAHQSSQPVVGRLEASVKPHARAYRTLMVDPPWLYTYETRKTEVPGTGWHETMSPPNSLTFTSKVSNKDIALSLTSVCARQRRAHEFNVYCKAVRPLCRDEPLPH